jgi:hypothetical protein
MGDGSLHCCYFNRSFPGGFADEPKMPRHLYRAALPSGALPLIRLSECAPGLNPAPRRPMLMNLRLLARRAAAGRRICTAGRAAGRCATIRRGCERGQCRDCERRRRQRPRPYCPGSRVADGQQLDGFNVTRDGRRPRRARAAALMLPTWNLGPKRAVPSLGIRRRPSRAWE